MTEPLARVNPEQMSVTDRARSQLTAVHLAQSLGRHRKVPLGMEKAERQRLMDLLLRIHEQAMASFDVLEADAVSEHDLSLMVQLHEYVNQFTAAMKAHAQRRIAEMEP